MIQYPARFRIVVQYLARFRIVIQYPAGFRIVIQYPARFRIVIQYPVGFRIVEFKKILIILDKANHTTIGYGHRLFCVFKLNDTVYFCNRASKMIVLLISLVLKINKWQIMVNE